MKWMHMISFVGVGNNKESVGEERGLSLGLLQIIPVSGQLPTYPSPNLTTVNW